MLKKIHEEIQTFYKNKKQENLNKGILRREEIFSKIPEYKELDDKLKMYYKSILTNINSDNSTSVSFSKEEIEDIISKKQNLLKINNYPLDYLENVYDCTVCKDSGYIKNQGRCSCYNNKVSKKLMNLSKLDLRLQEENFSKCVFDYYPKTKDPNTGLIPYDVAKSIYKFAQNNITNETEHIKNMYIYGNVGVGKTFLLNSIAKKALENSFSVIYLPSQELFNIINAYKFHDAFHELANQSFYDFLCSCDYLLIDDLGTEASTNFTQSEFFYILDLRMRTNKATIITSNLTLRNLEEQYSQRISSRISGDFRLLNLLGEDIRKIKKYKSYN